jgi:alanyl-tRNA synthetase
MLGNFSFGGYFKEEAIQYGYDFIVKEMGLKIDYVTVFEGESNVPADAESEKIWKSIDPKIVVKRFGRADNFWGPTGAEGPCGPTTEIYVDGIEVWNIVFNQYYQKADKTLEPLKTPGIDTGMGLERLAKVSQKVPTVFETDLFKPIITKLPSGIDERIGRIFADHTRSIAFLISDGVRPSNKEAGYVLRRLMRRLMVYGAGHANEPRFEILVEEYKTAYSELSLETILSVYRAERDKFSKTLSIGLKELDRMDIVDAINAFKLYESFGIPYEIIKEKAGERGKNLNRENFDEEFKKHQEISRAGKEAKFGGHGLYLKTGEVTVKDESELEKVTRLHTATHLMHAGLRAVLGPEVQQNGSDITVERTRFDFNFPRKVVPDELKKVEEWVNDAVKKNLTVTWRETTYEEAIKDGALGFFKQKYPPKVKVYTMADAKTGEVYSKEFCGGPHVEHTGAVGTFKILKEESSSAGVRRIRGVIEP